MEQQMPPVAQSPPVIGPKRSNKLIIAALVVVVIVIVAVVMLTFMNGASANSNVSRSAEDISPQQADFPSGWDESYSYDYDLPNADYVDSYGAIFTSEDNKQMVSCGIYKFSSVDEAKNYFTDIEESLSNGDYSEVSTGFSQCIKYEESSSYYMSMESYCFQDRNVIGVISFTWSYGAPFEGSFIDDTLDIVDHNLK